MGRRAAQRELCEVLSQSGHAPRRVNSEMGRLVDRGAGLRRDGASWLDVPFIRCGGEPPCSLQLVGVVASHMNTRSLELPEYSLVYVSFERVFNNKHVFSNF